MLSWGAGCGVPSASIGGKVGHERTPWRSRSILTSQPVLFGALLKLSNINFPSCSKRVCCDAARYAESGVDARSLYAGAARNACVLPVPVHERNGRIGVIGVARGGNVELDLLILAPGNPRLVDVR